MAKKKPSPPISTDSIRVLVSIPPELVAVMTAKHGEQPAARHALKDLIELYGLKKLKPRDRGQPKKNTDKS